MTERVDCREPEASVSRLLRLLERRRGDGEGEVPKGGRSWWLWMSSLASRS